ncbi:hypothetical protein ABT160_06730 [Streptomyces sp. NPDC001941]|uniref:bestrophin-like domain n=1 Tax=Streptomyces sp. NPDC001941 TaxID=3154659 RepID=UPI00332068A7
MSDWLVLGSAMAAACAVVLALTLVHHRRAARADADPTETPDVIEYMVMMVGVVYAIVLGLAIAGVWEARGAAQDGVRQEAQALHEIEQRVQVYPPARQAELRTRIDAYAAHVVRVEWPGVDERGDQLLGELRTDLVAHAPTGEAEAQMYQPLVDRVAALDEARGARAEGAEDTLPGVVWFGLIVGAVVTVGLIFTLQIRRSGRELLLAGVFSALIAFLLFLVWNFDAPYGRSGNEAAESFVRLFPEATTGPL